MGKQSTRENKTIYQICREEAGLTRLEEKEKMTAVSDSKIEKFEYEMQEPTPYDIIQMADAYGRPDLCNYYCSHKCEIGHRYVPEVEVSNLSNIILETIASLNEINPLTTRLIQIARDGKISDDEIKDFAECGLCGTAAVISPVGLLRYKDFDMKLSDGKIGELSQRLYDEMTGIQWGKKEDPFGWITKVC